jgi:hypothetical protein
MFMHKLGLRTVSVVASGSLLLGCGVSEGDLGPHADQRSLEVVRGSVENGRNYVMNLRIEYNSVSLPSGNRNVGFCSSVLFSPRVLLTAAHCINPLRTTPDGVSFVDTTRLILAYIGNNFQADLSALGPNPSAAAPPPPAASRFMLADSWETHPDWDVDILFPDLAAVYLDRQPRLPPNSIVDGLPVGRTRLGAATVGQLMTIVGYGASRALDAAVTQVEGQGIKRRGTMPFVGQPIINPLPADPHPGVLLANVRNGLMELNGDAPRSNACAGDSGGPAIRNVGGQDFVFGISSFGGNFCEDYSYYTRLDPFLPFVDQSYFKGGQAPLRSRLECITPRTGGGFRAYFGYNNENGIFVSVPYGANNSFPQDTQNRRPNRFAPGDHPFLFSLDFTARQTLRWRLAPTNSPTTQLTVTSTSPRCAPDNRGFVCTQACDASQAAACGEPRDACMDTCFQFYQGITPCEPAMDAYHRCVAQTPPTGFECFDTFPFAIECGPLLDAVFAECLVE